MRHAGGYFRQKSFAVLHSEILKYDLVKTIRGTNDHPYTRKVWWVKKYANEIVLLSAFFNALCYTTSILLLLLPVWTEKERTTNCLFALLHFFFAFSFGLCRNRSASSVPKWCIIYYLYVVSQTPTNIQIVFLIPNTTSQFKYIILQYDKINFM